MIWYKVSEKLPELSGRYLVYKNKPDLLFRRCVNCSDIYIVKFIPNFTLSGAGYWQTDVVPDYWAFLPNSPRIYVSYYSSKDFRKMIGGDSFEKLVEYLKMSISNYTRIGGYGLE